MRADLWDFKDTRCECGAEFDPTSSEWRCAGDHWQHYHSYPAGHAGRQVGYLKQRWQYAPNPYDAHAKRCGKPPGSAVQQWGDKLYWVLPDGTEEPLKPGEDPRVMRLTSSAGGPGANE